MDARTSHALREFFLRAIEASFACSIDGAEVQEWAFELGLVEAAVATQADCEDGFEGEPGDTIYQVPAWLRVGR